MATPDDDRRTLSERDVRRWRRAAEQHLDEARALYAEAEILERLLRRGIVVSRIDVKRTKICVRCETPFQLTAAERDWFTSKNLSIPRRCAACRSAVAQERQDFEDSFAGLVEQVREKYREISKTK